MGGNVTEIFSYDTLTWPEVAALSRHTPLVLPLGTGTPLAQLVEMLCQPQRIGLLPAIPFGWQGSGLTVPAPLL